MVDEMPRYQKLRDGIARIEADAWVRFAAGILASNSSAPVNAAREADEMMVEFRRRFLDAGYEP